MYFIQCCIDLTIASRCFSFEHIKHMAVKRRCWWCPGAALGSSLHFIPVVCSFYHRACTMQIQWMGCWKKEYTVVCKHSTYIIIHAACFCSVCLCECVWVNEGTASAVTCFLVQWQFGPSRFLSAGRPEPLPALAVDHTGGDSVKALLSAASPKAANERFGYNRLRSIAYHPLVLHLTHCPNL